MGSLVRKVFRPGECLDQGENTNICAVVGKTGSVAPSLGWVSMTQK